MFEKLWSTTETVKTAYTVYKYTTKAATTIATIYWLSPVVGTYGAIACASYLIFR